VNIIELYWRETLSIRHQVLWPNEKPEFCELVGDEQALHYGLKVNDKLVCVASIFMDGQSARLRKFATLRDFQGQGLGSVMISQLLDKLRAQHVNFFWFDARESATCFYERFGFKATGDLFYKNNIAYYKMSAHLSPPL